MRKLVLLLMFIFPVSLYAQNVQVRKNVFGGYNYTERGKLSVYTRPNVFGGYNYRGRVNGYTRPTLNRGFEYRSFSKPTQKRSSFNSFAPYRPR